MRCDAISEAAASTQSAGRPTEKEPRRRLSARPSIRWSVCLVPSHALVTGLVDSLSSSLHSHVDRDRASHPFFCWLVFCFFFFSFFSSEQKPPAAAQLTAIQLRDDQSTRHAVSAVSAGVVARIGCTG